MKRKLNRERLLLLSMICFAVVAVVTLLSLPLWAADAAQPADASTEPGPAATGLVAAIGSGQWGLAIGFGIMLIVWGLRVFAMPNVNTKALPWIATFIGALGAFSVAMVADPSHWIQALLSGVTAGLAAAGTWGLLPNAVKPTKEGAVGPG